MNNGILTGCDENQEWFLKWWWENYSRFNSAPVAFFDFGMSESAKLYCKSKGAVIDCTHFDFPFASQKEIPKLKWKMWERVYPGNIWKTREATLKKTLSLVRTPFTKSIWVDLDAKIQGDLTPLFTACEKEKGFAIAKAHPSYIRSGTIAGLYLPDQEVYNTGVFSFLHSSPILKRWIENLRLKNQEFMADEDLLLHTLYTEKLTVTELSRKYNWPIYHPSEEKPVILHYLGALGKERIFQECFAFNN
ncbi:MAG: hypothetical protein HYZ47_00350 [Simkania negevensis]|nr:hypothetical protein [Simkania negevensis]